MSTNAGAPQQGTDVVKLCERIAGELGVLHKECGTLDPSGATCDAVGQMITAIGHIEKQLMSGDPGGGMPQMEAEPPDGDGYPIAPHARSPLDMAAAAMMGGGAPAGPMPPGL